MLNTDSATVIHTHSRSLCGIPESAGITLTSSEAPSHGDQLSFLFCSWSLRVARAAGSPAETGPHFPPLIVGYQGIENAYREQEGPRLSLYEGRNAGGLAALGPVTSSPETELLSGRAAAPGAVPGHRSGST